MKLLFVIGIAFFALGLVVEIGNRRMWKAKADEWESRANGWAKLSEENATLLKQSLSDLSNSVHQAETWQKVAIMCAKRLGVDIEVTGPTNVVITVLP